jgi:hypothetical protein
VREIVSVRSTIRIAIKDRPQPEFTDSVLHIQHCACPPSPSINFTMSALDLSESQATFPSDSETYDANLDSPHNSSDVTPSTGPRQPMILYSPPTIWSIFRGAAINLILPFVNGLMLGFGELFAHEAAFRLGWSKTKVCWQTDVAGRAERGSLFNLSGLPSAS